MSRKKIVKTFLGAAMGVVLSDFALAQLAEAKTPTERAQVLAHLVHQGHIKTVRMGADGVTVMQESEGGDGGGGAGGGDGGFDRAGFDKDPSFDKGTPT